MMSSSIRLGRLAAALLAGLPLLAGAGCARLRPAGTPPPAAAGVDPETGTDAQAELVLAAQESWKDGYVLQPGDEIDIQVYQEPELSGTFRLSPAGEIRHPLLGTVPLGGRSVGDAEAGITVRLGEKYLVYPRVVLKVVNAQGSQIVVLGEVKSPGVYPVPIGQKTTLLQAIARAGGFTPLSSLDRVRIVRQANGQSTSLRVRVSEILAGRGAQQDIPLEPNDVIVVPEIIF